MAGNAEGPGGALVGGILWAKGTGGIYALDRSVSWYPAMIMAVKVASQKAKVHFIGFNVRYDRWVPWGCPSVVSEAEYNEYVDNNAEPPIPASMTKCTKRKWVGDLDVDQAIVEPTETGVIIDATPSQPTPDVDASVGVAIAGAADEVDVGPARRRLNYSAENSASKAGKSDGVQHSTSSAAAEVAEVLTSMATSMATATAAATSMATSMTTATAAAATTATAPAARPATRLIDADRDVRGTAAAAAAAAAESAPTARKRRRFLVPVYNRWKPSRPLEMSLRQVGKSNPFVKCSDATDDLAHDILSFLSTDDAARPIRGDSAKDKAASSVSPVAAAPPLEAVTVVSVAKPQAPAVEVAPAVAVVSASTALPLKLNRVSLESLLNKKLIRTFQGVGTFEGTVTKIHRSKARVSVLFEDGDVMKLTKRLAVQCIAAYEALGAADAVSDPPGALYVALPPSTPLRARPKVAKAGARSPPRSIASSAAAGKRLASTPRGKSAAVTAALSSGAVDDLRAALAEESTRADVAEAQVATLMVKLRAISEVSNMLSTTVSTAVAT